MIKLEWTWEHQISLDAKRALDWIIIPEIDSSKGAKGMQTVHVAKRCLLSTGRQGETSGPGFDEPSSFFPAGSWCFNALLAAQSHTALVWLLASYKGTTDGLGHKTLTGVWITELSKASYPTAGSSFKPTLIWRVSIASPDSDEKCATAWD